MPTRAKKKKSMHELCHELEALEKKKRKIDINSGDFEPSRNSNSKDSNEEIKGGCLPASNEPVSHTCLSPNTGQATLLERRSVMTVVITSSNKAKS